MHDCSIRVKRFLIIFSCHCVGIMLGADKKVTSANISPSPGRLKKQKRPCSFLLTSPNKFSHNSAIVGCTAK